MKQPVPCVPLSGDFASWVLLVCGATCVCCDFMIFSYFIPIVIQYPSPHIKPAFRKFTKILVRDAIKKGIFVFRHNIPTASISYLSLAAEIAVTQTVVEDQGSRARCKWWDHAIHNDEENTAVEKWENHSSGVDGAFRCCVVRGRPVSVSVLCVAGKQRGEDEDTGPPR